MTIEDQQNSTPGLSRRTALKAAAWSVPVIAAATAVPAYAASGETVDLTVAWLQSGEAFEGYNADRSKKYTVSIPTGVQVSNAGTVDVAAGSTLIMTYDARLFGPDAGASIDDAPLARTSVETSGNLTTATFILPAFPVGTSDMWIRAGMPLLANPDSLPWLVDIESYTLTITPASAVDATPENNTAVSAARYEDTTDGAVTATWGTKTVPNSQAPAAPHEIDVPETITITSLAPGATVDEVRIAIGIAQARDADSNHVGYLLESWTITSAELDGTDVLSSIAPASDDPRGAYVLTGQAFAPGSTLALTVETTLATEPALAVSGGGGGYVSISVAGDREWNNNSAYGPRW